MWGHAWQTASPKACFRPTLEHSQRMLSEQLGAHGEKCSFLRLRELAPLFLHSSIFPCWYLSKMH